jgi:hypothetical protein
MRRFIRLAGGDAKICEFNQEACRLNAFDGKKSLIRSFPSKVGVRAYASFRTRGVGETHAHIQDEEEERNENDAKWRFPKDKHWCKNDE